MTHTVATEPSRSPDLFLEESFLAVETPDGFTAELIEGEVVVNWLSENRHDHVISRTIVQFVERSKTEMEFSFRIGLALTPCGPHPKNRLVPDITLARDFRGDSPWLEPDEVTLVGEVTHLRPERDRVVKRRCYAKGGISLYLLIDREQRRVVLHRDPVGDDYADIRSLAFGRPVPLPEPFAFELDTSDFV
jgi:Uma2 family endonuclease